MNSRFTRAARCKLASRKHRVVSLESLEKRRLLTAELLPNPLLEGETSFVAFPSVAATSQAVDPLVPLHESLRSIEGHGSLEHVELTADAEQLAQRAFMEAASSVDALADRMKQQLQQRLPSNEQLRSQLLVTPVQPDIVAPGTVQPEVGQPALTSVDGVEPNTEFSVLVDGQIASRLLPSGIVPAEKVAAGESAGTQYTAMSSAVIDSDA